MTLQESDETFVDDVKGDSPEEVIPFEYSITSYEADYTVGGLVTRSKQGDILILGY